MKYFLVFGVGFVGIGKMYLVVVYVVVVFKKGLVKKLVLIRLVVEVGEFFGFLLGDLKEKVDFYLILFYDVLYDFLGIVMMNSLME